MSSEYMYNENSYFAAANSQKGFVSFFDKIFNPDTLERLYVIKGGSGTGKSRFMREIGDEARRRGEAFECFCCSSDPLSLDGIILCDRRIAIIDGTAPHTVDLIFPGCFDEIINLGTFWNSEILRSHKNEIVDLCLRKKELYSRAYSYLSVAGKLTDICDRIVEPYIKEDKLASWARRICDRIERSSCYSERIRLTDAISALGKTSLDSFYKQASKRYILSDNYRISHIVLAALAKAVRRRGISHTVSFDPLDTSKINGLLLEGAGVSFTSAPTGGADLRDDIVINTERFFDKNALREHRAGVRYMNKCACFITDMATDTMKQTFKLHTELEKIYISAMDFDAKEEYTRAFIKQIFSE